MKNHTTARALKEFFLWTLAPNSKTHRPMLANAYVVVLNQMWWRSSWYTV